MIASLQGTLESLGSNFAIINVHGIGFQVFMPTSTLSNLNSIGKEIYLHTNLVLREDSVTLYGFATSDELGLFQLLLGVSGIGPKLALSILSAMSVEQACTAIATASVDLLKTVPGIGKKTAERLVLELKDKIGTSLLLTSPAGQITPGNSEVMAALTSLGYSVNEASRAVASLPASELSLEEKVKLALQYFGNK